MEHFVTLFDVRFLLQGLALYDSLVRSLFPFRLWVLCMDRQAFNALSALKLPHVELMRVEDVETAVLKAVRLERTAGEYCWTLTPFAPKFVFERDSSIARVTYLDADVWFLKSPSEIFQSFDVSGKGVLITSHAYSPEFDQSASAGRYCVQFVSFLRDRGEEVRSWWADRCLEWCYGRLEDGKFGDQKYLDDWPQRFADSVYVAMPESAFQGPWNLTRFPPSEATLFHFHGLRTLPGSRFLLAPDVYLIPQPALQAFYDPYCSTLNRAKEIAKGVGIELEAQLKTAAWVVAIKSALKRAARRVLRSSLAGNVR